MRHGKKVNHLGRKTAHRKSMLANMACSLIEHKRINTTVAKAKALKQFVDYNEIYNAGKAVKKKTTRRSRRGGASTDAPVVVPTEAKNEEE